MIDFRAATVSVAITAPIAALVGYSAYRFAALQPQVIERRPAPQAARPVVAPAPFVYTPTPPRPVPPPAVRPRVEPERTPARVKQPPADPGGWELVGRTAPPSPDITPAATASVPPVELNATGECALCGAKVLSWVEVEGRRVGYCPRHSSTPTQPATAAPAEASSTGTATGSTLEQSAQCQGTTKAGNRCRRKTRHASGYCPQHRPETAGL